jgi:hypothetical protein
MNSGQLQYGIQLTDTFTNPDLSPFFSATIGGMFNDQGNLFQEVSTGIMDKNMELNARGNTIDNCEYGIYARDFQLQQITDFKKHHHQCKAGDSSCRQPRNILRDKK